MSTLGANDDILQANESLTPANEAEINDVSTASEIAEIQQETIEVIHDDAPAAQPEEVAAEPAENPEPEDVPAETDSEPEPATEPDPAAEPVEVEAKTEDDAETASEEAETDEEAPQENAKTDEEVPQENAETDEEAPQENAELLADLSKTELVEKLKELLNAATVDKNEVDAIKQAFYKKLKAEQAELLKKHTDDGGEKDSFILPKDAQEEVLRELLSEYRTKKNEENLQLQEEKENNFKTKSKILDELKSLSENLDNLGDKFNDAIQNVRNMQQEWKNTGQVPSEKSAELWKTYQLYIEKFYDYKKISDELREYDLKKNLEAKIAFCEQAEKLAGAKDVLAAFRALQKLHDEWKEIGPVSREFREEIWERFKTASNVINKKHQEFFEHKKANEEKNFVEKAALCEEIEAIDYSGFSNIKDWEGTTAKIVELQAKWKTIGFAPKKVNVKIYERFREGCDRFFRAKNEFFKSVKGELSDNLRQKIQLCEQAEALKDSTDWKETADKLVALQKEWKTIGTVPRRQSDIVWKRFVTACDYFFDQKGKVTSSEKEEQTQNLQAKKDIIAKIEALDITDPKEAEKTLRNLIADWNDTGFVPFKEKDRIYKVFKTAAGEAFDKLNIDESNRRLHTFRTHLEDSGDKSASKLFRERDKLKKDLEFLRSEISTFENNIGFFSSSSKADKLIQDMEKKIAKLKNDRELIMKKIEAIENNL